MTVTTPPQETRHELGKLLAELEAIMQAQEAVDEISMKEDIPDLRRDLQARQFELEAKILARTPSTPREAECWLAIAASRIALEAERLAGLAGAIERGVLAALAVLRPEIGEPLARRYRPAPGSDRTAA